MMSVEQIYTIFLSQSLWVRDRFLMHLGLRVRMAATVAIPLGQGQVFNVTNHDPTQNPPRRNPFGSGTGF